VHLCARRNRESVFRLPEGAYIQEREVQQRDLGQPGRPVVEYRFAAADADALLVESIYGDRCHKSRDQPGFRLRFVVDVDDSVRLNAIRVLTPSSSR
jgi:hypothetical protein